MSASPPQFLPETKVEGTRGNGNQTVLLYLDLNCFNRPFDDQNQDRIAQETVAVLAILQRIIDGVDQPLWSAMLDFENAQHPLVDRRMEIARWAHYVVITIAVSQQIAARAYEFTAAGLRPLDAAHLACAEAAACDRLLTGDDQVLRKAQSLPLALHVQNPRNYIQEIPHA